MSCYLIRLCSLLLIICSFAQAAPLSLRFEHLGVEQGLTQESITKVIQDKYGYLWIGTQAGLNRYDGYRMTVFKNDPTDPGSLRDNYIQALYEDSSGQLWIGSKGGLDRYDPSTRKFVHQQINTSAALSVSSIAGDGKQGLWLATSEGLLHLDIPAGKLETLRHAQADADSLGDDHVNVVTRDKSGNLWVGTATGLEMMPAGETRFRHLAPQAESSAANNILVLSAGPDGVMWAGSLNGLQAWKLKPGDDKPQRLPLAAADTFADQQINALLHDSEGTLWVGTIADGLKRRDAATGRFYHYRRDIANQHGIGDNQVTALYQDRTGTLWVGNWYTGLDWVDLASGGFERYAEYTGVLPSIGDSKVRAIVGAGDNMVWLGSAHGLIRLDVAKGTTQAWRHDEADPASLPSDLIIALVTDQQGRLWVGSTSGLSWRDPSSGRYTRVAIPGAPNSNSIQRLLVDRAGIVWAGTRNSLLRIDPASFAVTTYSNDPDDRGTLDGAGASTRLLEDRQRTCCGSGPRTAWTASIPRPASSVTFGMTLQAAGQPEPQARASICTRMQAGAACGWGPRPACAWPCPVRIAVRELHFRFYPVQAGRASDPIGAILPDDKGRLWISSTAGLLLFTSGDRRVQAIYVEGWP
jgi:ligand-binding sensor domain-containing protein